MAFKDKIKARAYYAAWQRAYRRKHPERVRATEQRRDKAALAKYRRERRADGRDDYKAILRKSYRKHKAKRNAEAKAYREANWQAILLYMRSWKARRRAMPAVGHFTKADIERKLKRQNNKCRICYRLFGAKLSYTVDHIHPLSRGGSNWPKNIQLLCLRCNQVKGASV